jgi:hypothetical protein
LEEYNINKNSLINKEQTPIKFTDKLEENIYNLLLIEALNINEIFVKT